MIKRKKEIDIENLNSVIDLTKKILKVLFVAIILAIIFIVLVLCSRLHITKIFFDILSVISPLFIGFVVAWLLNSLVVYFTKKKVNRTLASVFVFSMFLVVLFLIIKFMIPMLYKQINEFIEIVPTLFLQVNDFIHNTFSKFDATGFDFSSVESKIYDALQEFGSDLTTSLPAKIINGVSSVVSSVWSVILGLIVGFYLLIDFDGLKKVFNIVPKKHRTTVKKLAQDLDSTCKDFVQGTLLIALIVAVITSILFTIIGLPSPMLFGLICGVTNIIPYIGPWVGGGIATIVGFTVSPLVGILAVVVAFVSQQIDGIVLQPLIMGKTMKLHPVTIMIGLLVFGYLFGVLGMIIATPLIACIKIVLTYFAQKYKLKERFIDGEEIEGEE